MYEHFASVFLHALNPAWSHRDHHQIDNRWTRTWLGLRNTRRLARLFVIMFVVKGQREDGKHQVIR